MFSAFKFLPLLPLLLAAGAARSESPIGHDLDVLIDPERGTITASDLLILPDGLESWEFYLHRDLNPQVVSGDATLARIGEQGHLEHFRLRLDGSSVVRLGYGGRISHRLEELREGMGRTRQSSLGIISAEGVVLDGYSGWYPRSPDRLQRFDLQVQLPAGWTAVSQGEGPGISEDGDGASVHWQRIPTPGRHLPDRGPLPALFEGHAFGEAQSLPAPPTRSWPSAISRPRTLPGAVQRPYRPVPLRQVRPGGELLGDRLRHALVHPARPAVIRLPFILHTSYPHEILHNWWGNGVYVDYETGNWSEGLTAYLADHLLKEQRGRGATTGATACAPMPTTCARPTTSRCGSSAAATARLPGHRLRQDPDDAAHAAARSG